MRTLLVEFNQYIIERLIERRKIDPVTKCWEWQGCLIKGYGVIKFKHGGKNYRVHRLIAYIVLGFSLNSELAILHRCDNRKCFNPLHLFIGDNYDNMRDMVAKGRHDNGRRSLTHCKQGHEFSEENTYLRVNGGRGCKTCKKQWNSNRSLKNANPA